MSSVEAAASLFGSSDDPASDPFATLGSEQTESTNADSSTLTPNHVSSADQGASDTSNLFGVDTGGGDIVDINNTSQHQDTTSWSQPAADALGQNALSYASGETSESSYAAAEGWYDEHGQWHYSEHPVHPAEQAPPAASQNLVNPSYAHDPYAPSQANSTTHAYSQQSYQPPQPASRSAYSSYAPATNYTPAQPAAPPASSAYSPYAPAQASSPYDRPRAAPTKSYTSQSSLSVNTVAPDPPKPLASPYRPKTFDAYDPPLPPPKPSKRAVSRPAPPRTVSPVGQQTYPSYGAYPSPAPHLPPDSTSPHPPPSSHRLPPPRSDSFGPPHAHVNGQRAPAYRQPGNGLPGTHDPYSSAAYPHNYQNVGRASPRQPTSYDSSPTTGNAYVPHENGIHALYSAAGPPQSGGHAFNVPARQATTSPSYFPAGATAASPQYIDGAEAGSQSNGAFGLDTSSQPLFGHGPSSSDSQPRYDRPGVSPPPPPARTRPYSPRTSSPLHTTAPQSSTSLDAVADFAWTAPSTEHAQNPSQPSGETISLRSAHGPASASGWSPPSSEAGHAPASAVTSSNGPRTGTPPAAAANALERPRSSASSTYTPSHSPQLQRSHTPPTYSSTRVASPGTTSVRSEESSRKVYDPYAPTAAGYAPPPAQARSRDSSFSIQRDPYAPPPTAAVKDSRDRSMSNGSVYSAPETTKPYAPPPPPHHSRHQPSQESDYGPSSSQYGYPSQEPSQYVSRQSVPEHPPPAIQELSLAPATVTPYAPSPSLLGSNDPLGRRNARAPLLSFGFGGKVVTCFHGSSSLNTGFDVALSSRRASDVKIQLLHQMVPESAMNNSSVVFPGPLFGDPGTPTTTNLVRSGASQVKAKKVRVMKYLDERAEELAQGIGYLHDDDKIETEGKLVLVKLLKVMVENDGRLSGSPQIDSAVRAALVSRLSDSAISTEGANGASTFASVADLHDIGSPSYVSLNSAFSAPSENPLSITTLKPSSLAKIQEFLLRGERRKAYHYALDESLWAHAMIIASSIDKEAWKEVVQDFLKSELGVKDPISRTNGHESLRVAYSLFSGLGAASVQQLIPPNMLAKPGALSPNGLQVPPPAAHVTPVSPNFPPSSVTATIPPESLANWTETVAMMISSPLTLEISSALTALGDYLLANKRTEAAHSCYLLSPQTSQLGGAGAPSARIVLLGSRSPLSWPIFHKDPDPIIFSEIAEFALSLATPAKGQESFSGLPHLQAYRLVRAAALAEFGHVQTASRYCEAISGLLSRPSPYITTPFVEQLKGLSDRLTAAPHVDKLGSWIGGKMSKPSLDSIGNWLEGRFSKFIAGEGDSSPPATDVAMSYHQEHPTQGAFSHYSTISSAAPSASPSPKPSMSNLNVASAPAPPPRRTGSAMDYHPSSNPHVQIDRASSAMDYSRTSNQKSSAVPRVASASAATTTFAQSTSFGQAMGYGSSPMQSSPIQPSEDLTTPTQPHDSTADEEGNTAQTATWWGSSYEDSSTVTPTATAFVKVEGDVAPSSDGFISLMDDNMITVTPSSPMKKQTTHALEDDDDLGLGNSRRQTSDKGDAGDGMGAENAKEKAVKVEPAKAIPQRPDLQSSSTGSWLSRWWKKSDSPSPGPVKASLGEETSFYYDKELKRWVNKKAGSEDAKPAAPPPPPSRAQTASPAKASSTPPVRSTTVPPTGPPAPGPPPARPASAAAADLGAGPPVTKSVQRIRSNLVPDETESAPSTPAASADGLAPPHPPSRPQSAAAKKRNVRNRYVDVLQQQ